MARVTLPNWEIAPAFESLAAALERYGVRVGGHRLHLPDDSAQSFAEFLTITVDKLSRRSIGNADDLMVAYGNAVRAGELTNRLKDELLKHELPPRLNPRTQVAFLNVIAAAQMVNSALFTHVRENEWYECATLSILRTALELSGKSVYVARGTGDEPERWYHGPKMPTLEERRAAQLPAGRSVASLNDLVAQRELNAPAPDRAYAWLCGFTHMDSNAIEPVPSHQDAYAALAYVAWVCAVAAEHVTGVPDLAVYPTRWPTVLPWD